MDNSSFLPGYADATSGGAVASNQVTLVNPQTGNTVGSSFAVTPTIQGNKMLRLRIVAAAERDASTVLPIFPGYAILNSAFTGASPFLANLAYTLPDQSFAAGSITSPANSSLQVMNFVGNFLGESAFVLDYIVFRTNAIDNLVGNRLRTYANSFANQEVNANTYLVSQGYTNFVASGTFEHTITNVRGTTMTSQMQMTLGKINPSTYIELEIYIQGIGFQSTIIPA